MTYILAHVAIYMTIKKNLQIKTCLCFGILCFPVFIHDLPQKYEAVQSLHKVIHILKPKLQSEY